MEKSIEAIWKEGFLSQDAIVAPKVNDLYNRKSQHLVDKMTRMFNLNHIYIGVLIAVFLIGGILLGAPWSGAVIAVMLIAILVLGRIHMKQLDKIEKGDSSYDYIKSFDLWLKGTMREFTVLYRIFYPVFFMAMVFGFWNSHIGRNVGDKVISEFPGLELVFGFPLYALIVVLVIAFLLIFAGSYLYRLDMYTVYGPIMGKLDDLVEDMEELRK